MKVDKLYEQLDDIEKGILRHLLLTDKELEDNEELEFYKKGYEEYKNEYRIILEKVSIFDSYKKEINDLLLKLKNLTHDKKILTKKTKKETEEIIKRLLYIYNVERIICNTIKDTYSTRLYLGEDIFK